MQKHNRSEQRRDLLGNRLVVVVPADSLLSLNDLTDLKADKFQLVALAREGVPAGIYAREALKNAGVWEALKGRIVEGGDVRATLMYVVRGEADAGFVYATDVAASSKVRLAFTVPEKLHAPIRYPLVVVRRDAKNPAAQRFFDYLSGDKATAQFQRAGFQTLQ